MQSLLTNSGLTSASRMLMLAAVVIVVDLPSATAQQTYWLGRREGSHYVFDQQLPKSFSDAIGSADSNRFKVVRNPVDYPATTAVGATYSFIQASITSDRAMFDGRLPKRAVSMVSAVHGGGGSEGSWIYMDTSENHVEAFAKTLPARDPRKWFRTDLLIAVSSSSKQPTMRVPIPATTLARLEMIDHGKHTLPGFFYPNVQRPTHIVPFRNEMLAYGNAGRRDPDFRKKNKSKTATDLSGNTTYVGETDKWEPIDKDRETAPYFVDHVLSRELTEAAQFQAEYQASIASVTHDGPPSYKGDRRVKDFNTRVGYFNGPGKSFEACGAGSMGDFPHTWMVGETHFRPWFNVGGPIYQVGYGAAKNTANGQWYYTAVISQTPANGQNLTPPAAKTTPAKMVANTPSPGAPGSGPATVPAGGAAPSAGGTPQTPPASFAIDKKLSHDSMAKVITAATAPNTGHYKLVYDANLTKLGPGFSYDTDNSQSVGAFDRIGYLLELSTRPTNGGSVFDKYEEKTVFVTMKAFTNDATKIGIPTAASGASFQQDVEDLNVHSTVDGINGMGAGRIEFWSNDYLPGTDGVFNSSDVTSGRDHGHGSMQVHDRKGQTIFALNGWDGGPRADLGIGNGGANGTTDWTLTGTAKLYPSRRLRVYVGSGSGGNGGGVPTASIAGGGPTNPAMTRPNNAGATQLTPTQTQPANSVSNLTAAEQNAFVQYHNKVRAEVGVGPVTWSEDIARVAQEYANHLANTGDFKHRNEVGGSWQTSLGENLAWGVGGGYTAISGAEWWYAEKKDYTPGTPINGSSPHFFKIGHYTQMVWNKTTKIGAGVATIKTGQFKGGLIIVCNYDPAGNMTGQKPY